MRSKTASNIITHIVYVLDGSLSMARHKRTLIDVIDAQNKHLASRSAELDQETRVTIYEFSDANRIDCLVWDKDVARHQSIAGLYEVYGNTALIDATLKAINDLDKTPQFYGEHAFLLYVVTDGEENASKARPENLRKRLASLPPNWTVAALVPDAQGMMEAKRFGFPAGNVQIWNRESHTGAVEVGATIRQATDNYMTARTMSGLRSTTSLFSLDTTGLNASTVAASGLKPLALDQYVITHVPTDSVIRDFVIDNGLRWKLGSGFYELTVPVRIQPNKLIAIMERNGAQRVFVGREARQILGLPDHEVRVEPAKSKEYIIFVQSNANNRKLRAHTKFLYLKG